MSPTPTPLPALPVEARGSTTVHETAAESRADALVLRSPASRAVLGRSVARWSGRFGSASRAELEALAGRALVELEGGEPAAAPHARAPLAGASLPTASVPPPLATLSPDVGVDAAERVCSELERAHEARYGRAALESELGDERARDRARQSSAELVRYQAAWERKLARLQRAHPARWRVAGLSDDEVRDAITLRLIELLVAAPANGLPAGRPARPWALCVAQQHLAHLRRHFRLGATLTSFDTTPAIERGPNQEQRCLELEADARFSLASERAQGQLNRAQRRWLAAMQHAASEGHFFRSSDELNLSAASRELGKNRSSAQRAYRALEQRFQRELERLE